MYVGFDISLIRWTFASREQEDKLRLLGKKKWQTEGF